MSEEIVVLPPPLEPFINKILDLSRQRNRVSLALQVRTLKEVPVEFSHFVVHYFHLFQLISDADIKNRDLVLLKAGDVVLQELPAAALLPLLPEMIVVRIGEVPVRGSIRHNDYHLDHVLLIVRLKPGQVIQSHV